MYVITWSLLQCITLSFPKQLQPLPHSRCRFPHAQPRGQVEKYVLYELRNGHFFRLLKVYLNVRWNYKNENLWHVSDRQRSETFVRFRFSYSQKSECVTWKFRGQITIQKEKKLYTEIKFKGRHFSFFCHRTIFLFFFLPSEVRSTSLYCSKKGCLVIQQLNIINEIL
jgi:hypothetical protein